MPEIRHKKKYSQTYCALGCSSNLARKPKKFENNFSLLKYHEGQPVRNLERNYSHLIDRERHLISTFDVYFNNIPIADVLSSKIKSFFVSVFVDRTFDSQAFVESAQVALKLVSKLISEDKISELEGLVTPECLSKLEENKHNWVPMNRGNIAVTESDFVTAILYNLEVIPGDNNQRAIQGSVFYFIIKELIPEIGEPEKTKNVSEYIKQMESAMKAGKTYGANYRFVKWIYDDKSSDWIINGINHFKISDENKESSQN